MDMGRFDSFTLDQILDIQKQFKVDGLRDENGWSESEMHFRSSSWPKSIFTHDPCPSTLNLARYSWLMLGDNDIIISAFLYLLYSPSHLIGGKYADSPTENRARQTNPVIEENPSYVIQANDDKKKLEELSEEVHR